MLYICISTYITTYMDILQTLGEIGLGSRLKRLSEILMKEIQIIYKEQNIDFDPYLFPAFYNIATVKSTTNTELKETLLTSQPAVTQTVNKLLKKELIKLKIIASDRRKKNIILSTKGSKLFLQLQPLWAIMDETVKEYTRVPSLSLLEYIQKFEDVLKNGSFRKKIKEKIDHKLVISIVPYKNEYLQDFYDLNIEWLETFFYVEDLDKEVLSKAHKYIIEPGGYIFFAKEGDTVVGTVALMKINEEVYELTKMAVSPKHRGKKIGQKLMQYCIDFSNQYQFSKLILYSNTKLENAIYIYRKYGFIEIDLEPDTPYDRSDIKMELILKD